MATGQGNGQGANADKKKWLTILVPAAGVAVLVVLVAVMAGIGGSGRPMSDGSDGSADDPGLKEISPGVKYRDLKEGQGEPAPAGGKVKIHYTGWLTDGTVFDSSKDKGPATFELGSLIAGWQEGIPGMKPGGIRKLVISPEKGYKSQTKGKIPGNSTLIFEVELLEVVSGGAAGGSANGPGRPMSDGSDGSVNDPGLKEIGGGLKIRDLKEGAGQVCPRGVRVVAHYTGWLTNGEVFDSSRKRGEPTEFSLNEVVKGWQDGIPGMKIGGIRKLVIPPDQAYGSRGRPGIPPDSTLIFEVELVAIK